MKSNKFIILAILFTIISITIFLYSCTPPKTEPVRPFKIADGDIDPANWGKAYPLHYELWKKTESLPRSGKASIRKGLMQTKSYTINCLSFHLWPCSSTDGASISSTMNPEGMPTWSLTRLILQRGEVKAGASALRVKRLMHQSSKKKWGQTYYKMPFKEVHAKISEQFQKLGVACIDCHNSSDMSLHIAGLYFERH